MSSQSIISISHEWQELLRYNIAFATAGKALQYDFWKTPRENYLLLFGNEPDSEASPLDEAALGHLQKIDIYGTDVDSIQPLVLLPWLKEFYFGATPITQLDDTVLPKGLEKLCCYNTPLQQLVPLRALTKLRRLCIARTPITDISPLSGLVQLEKLSMYRTMVTDLRPLQGMVQLQKLNINYTPVQDVTPLYGLSMLKELHCFGTQIAADSLLQLQVALPACTIIQDYELPEDEYDDFA